MAIYPRCADTLPPPLNQALIPVVWECVPPPEKRLAVIFADAIGTPVTELARTDLEALLTLGGLSISEARMNAFRGNWAIDFFDLGGNEYWRVNRAWMTHVRDARLLGCCQESQNDCYIMKQF